MSTTAETLLPISPSVPWLAPLAGYTDLPFRLLCREYGAGVVCSEMVSAKGLFYKSTGTEALLETSTDDSPMVVQLFGCDPTIMEQAMRPLCEQGYQWFDLNMGCSVKKVVKTGCGAAMLKDVDTAIRVARTMVAIAGEGKVGFKFRLGWEKGEEVFLELAQRLEDVGAGWVSLHPRYARQGFSGEANWEALARLVDAVSLPVIASGDLFTAEDAVRCVRETGVSTVMFARGALNNPAVFEEYTTLLAGNSIIRPDPLKTANLIQRHVHLARQYGSDRTALFKMRTFVPRYVREFPGARTLRNHLASCMTWDDLDELLETFFTYWNRDCEFFEPETICVSEE